MTHDHPAWRICAAWLFVCCLQMCHAQDHQNAGGRQPDPSSPVDEAMAAGKTVDDFPAESRDVFRLMDQVAGPDGNLSPLALDPNDANDVNVIRGRNTWMLWCDGNEGFWDWLAQHGYGLLDFLKLIDSRQRNRRFRDLGLVNQPGMVGSDEPGPWGLYLDKLERPLTSNVSGYKGAYDYADYKDPQGRTLKGDGVDPQVYGYPSGVLGFRLFPNPNFEGNAEAQRRWNARAYYDDPSFAADPQIVRPFRVGMSCVLCHVAPHPLNPPVDPEEPEWENLSAIIGNQYFRTSAVLSSELPRGNFLWHFLASQQPGTVDTSMVSTDQINNANAMNGVFDLPARETRSFVNPAEEQAAAAQSLPTPLDEGVDPRRTPRILMDGADSVGTWGALARVYLNIGTYWEEWNRCNNVILGLKPQRPFRIDVSRSNSVYWQVNEKYRVNYLASYFLYKNDQGQLTTQPMLLKNARVHESDGGVKKFSESSLARKHPSDQPLLENGRTVFARNCLICHSSKQPSGYEMHFAHQPIRGGKWQDADVADGRIVLPFAWEDWEDFKTSPAYLGFAAKAVALSREEDFLKDNYLSTDRRIPVSLVGTNSGRALATNALEGQVWADYSSETYKNLPAVGKVAYHNPFNGKTESYQPKAGGRGYYRVPSLISVWATAPLLHNNSLGRYIPDNEAARRVSVAGRLEMFDDAIGKLLWKERRGLTPSGEEGLRDPGRATWRGTDPGWIFRTENETYLTLPRLHVRPAVETLVPAFLLFFVDWPWVIPLLLLGLTALLSWWSRTAVFYLALAAGVVLLLVLLLTGLVYLLPGWWPALALLLLAAAIVALIFARGSAGEPAAQGTSKLRDCLLRAAPYTAPVTLCLLSLAIWDATVDAQRLVTGQAEFRLGPIPPGTPVNALMNLDPEASVGKLLAASRGLLRTLSIIKRGDLEGEEALQVFNRYAGPPLLRASKCPDYVLDRGHYFGESLSDNEKEQLIAFLKTL